MQVPVISIGNSKGLRLSKSILDQYNIKGKVELVLEKDHIAIRPISQPRQGWDTAFRRMAEAGDDALLIDDVWADEAWEEWS